MALFVTLPNNYKSPSKTPSSWPGTTTSASFSHHDRHHQSGNTTTDNQTKQTLSENINAGGSNSLYTSEDGFYSSVQTKTNNVFYSQHFIGHKNGNTIQSGNSISTSTQSTWLQDVIGFHCEISSLPTGSGSEADGCGQVNQWRIAAVYADPSNKCRIMEMTNSGVKLSSHAFNSNPGGGWTILSYSLNASDAAKVINNKWLLYGWIIEHQHQKTCGGGTQNKNCTGRTRYLRPLVSNNGNLGSSYDDSLIVFHWENTLSTVRSSSGAKMLQTL